MTLEDLSRLETMHAEVHPAAPAEIYQWFPEMAKALREARAEVERLKESVANLDALYVSRTDELRESEAEVERLREALRVAAAGVCFARSACACATCAARTALKEVAP